MTATFFIILVGIFIVDTALGAWLGWAARSEKYGKYRIHKGRNPIAEKQRVGAIALNYGLPQVMYGGFLYFFGNHELYVAMPSIPRLLVETLGVIMLYDFMYYFFHRALHTRTGMRMIHGIHHRIRYATAEAFEPWDIQARVQSRFTDGCLQLHLAVLAPFGRYASSRNGRQIKAILLPRYICIDRVEHAERVVAEPTTIHRQTTLPQSE